MGVVTSLHRWDWRHYVFGLSVRLCVRTCAPKLGHFATGLPSTFSISTGTDCFVLGLRPRHLLVCNQRFQRMYIMSCVIAEFVSFRLNVKLNLKLKCVTAH